MEQLNKKLQLQFDKMCATGKLFVSSVTGRQVWETYLSSFSSKHDPIFRDPQSSTHNCNHCNNFVRRYGNVVAIDDNFNIMSIFDVECDEEYQSSMNKMSQQLRNAPIADVFFETFDSLNGLPYEKCKKNQDVFRLGVDRNHKIYTEAEADQYGEVEAGKTYTFDHMFLNLPSQFVATTAESIESIQSRYRSNKEVFMRGMEEIPLDTLLLVKDLIKQGSLLDGQTHVHKVEQIIPFKEEYDTLSSHAKDNWSWVKSFKLPIAKFKNELIGVLCTELAEGEEINKACQSWNKRVDPANYMKAVAPITENQKKMAQEFVEENGYVESFDRRFAKLDDIKADEIRHMNVGEGKIKEVSMFDNIKTKSTRHKRNEFKGVEEVSIERFMQDILPSCSSVEAYLENRLENNLVTLTTSNDQDAKQIFKWDNPYSWTYKGNLAGKSMIKEAVKSRGGGVDGALRFSIMWADGDGDNSDLDAHCIEPSGNRIFFSSKRNYQTGGVLDIDIQRPQDYNKDVVENITFPDLNRMQDGVYKMMVHQYAARRSKGFKAEIEFNGEMFNYEYNQRVTGYVKVAEVTLKNGEFTIKHLLPSTSSSKEMYGLDTQEFHKVNLVCLSPNHWGDNNTGNQHCFFMLEGCKTDSPIRSFHAENLKSDVAEHRKVLEVLGAVNMIEPDGSEQLSGLGFNTTVRDEVILRLQGSHKRVVKVKF